MALITSDCGGQVGTAAIDRDKRLTLAEYLAAGGYPALKEYRAAGAAVADKELQQMVADEEWCKIVGDLLVPAVPADLVIAHDLMMLTS